MQSKPTIPKEHVSGIQSLKLGWRRVCFADVVRFVNEKGFKKWPEMKKQFRLTEPALEGPFMRRACHDASGKAISCHQFSQYASTTNAT
jgi:hypothetical protein